MQLKIQLQKLEEWGDTFSITVGVVDIISLVNHNQRAHIIHFFLLWMCSYNSLIQ